MTDRDQDLDMRVLRQAGDRLAVGFMMAHLTTPREVVQALLQFMNGRLPSSAEETRTLLLASYANLVAGGIVLMSAAGEDAKAPAFLLGALGGNALYNSLLGDVPGAINDVGVVAHLSPLNPYGADEVGLTPQQIYEDATVYHTRGTPQVGTRPIRPPL